MKKRNFRILALLLSLLLLASGCAPNEDGLSTKQMETETLPAETEAAPVMQKQKSDRFGLAYVPEYGLNPYTCNCLTNRPIISLAYEGLFTVNANFEAEPVLCDSFAVDDDGLTYYFKIRDDAVFYNTSPVTAEDVVASLRKSFGSKYYGTRLQLVNSFSVFDEKTVKIKLDTPYENLPLLLDVPVVKKGTEENNIPVGSGPYRIMISDGCMVRNTAWWQGSYRAIANDRIELQAGASDTDIRDSFEFGSTNLILADLNSASKVGYRCDYELWTCNTTVMQYIGFNLYSGVFTDKAFRRAITNLIDRQKICEVQYQGFALPSALPCSPKSTLFDESLDAEFGYDTVAFYKKLQEASVSHETPITLLVWSGDATRVELANSIAEKIENYNYTVNVVLAEYDTYKARLNSGNFDMYLGEVRLSANFDLSQFFSENGTLNFGSLSNGEAYDLCIKTLENSGNSYDLYRYILDRGLLCPLLFKTYAVMVTRGTMTNVQPALDNVFHLPGGRSLVSAGVSVEDILNSGQTEETADAG